MAKTEKPTPAWRSEVEPQLQALRGLASTLGARSSARLQSEDPKLRFMVVGEPGQGQELVTDALATELFDLGMIGTAQVTKFSIDNFRSSMMAWRESASEPPVNREESKLPRLPASLWCVDSSLTSLGPRNGPPPEQMLSEALRIAVEFRGFEIPIVLVLDRSMEEEIDKDTALRTMFPRRIRLPRVTAEEISAEVEFLLGENDYTLSASTRKELISALGANPQIKLGDAIGLIDELIFAHGARTSGEGAKKALRGIGVADVEAVLPAAVNRRSVEEVMSEFDDLVGMDSLRERLEAMAALATTRRNNAVAGRPLGDKLDNFVFIGPPGTGKTTVARKMGELYAALGLLRSGHVVVRDRASIVGPYVGHSEMNMLAAIKEAREGVLFIDEAYGLADNTFDGSGTDSRDFGALALQALIAALTNEDLQPFVCVVAGYPDQMEAFFESNPGLASRFTSKLTFDSYSGDVLAEIFSRAAEKRRLTVGADARRAARSVLEQMRDENPTDFGNARDSLTLLDRAIEEASMRLVRSDGMDAVVTEIVAEDLHEARASLGLSDMLESDNDRAKGDETGDIWFPTAFEKATETINAMSDWTESAKSALADQLSKARRGNQFGFSTSLPRTIADILVSPESGINPIELAGVLADFYVELGALRTKKVAVLRINPSDGVAKAVGEVDEFIAAHVGGCVVVEGLDDCSASSSIKGAGGEAMLALADGMRRNRNDILVVALDSGELSESGLAGASLASEFELRLV